VAERESHSSPKELALGVTLRPSVVTLHAAGAAKPFWVLEAKGVRAAKIVGLAVLLPGNSMP